jgi:hypothetical protein
MGMLLKGSQGMGPVTGLFQAQHPKVALDQGFPKHLSLKQPLLMIGIMILERACLVWTSLAA